MTSDAAPLIALEARRCAAIGARDADALADVLDDEYVHVLAPGRVVNKRQYLAMIQDAPRKPERDGLHVRVYGDAAVITGDLDNHIGDPASAARRIIRAYCTQVAVRRGDHWRFVSYILTRKPRAE